LLLEWKDGLRGATISLAEGFGASWSGGIKEAAALNASGGSDWGFRLHADHLDATELDRWFGPRARPNWLQRLLPSLLGNNNAGAKTQRAVAANFGGRRAERGQRDD